MRSIIGYETSKSYGQYRKTWLIKRLVVRDVLDMPDLACPVDRTYCWVNDLYCTFVYQYECKSNFVLYHSRECLIKEPKGRNWRAFFLDKFQASIWITRKLPLPHIDTHRQYQRSHKCNAYVLTRLFNRMLSTFDLITFDITLITKCVVSILVIKIGLLLKWSHSQKFQNRLHINIFYIETTKIFIPKHVTVLV